MNSPTASQHDELERRLAATLHGHLDRVSATSDLTGPAVTRSRRIRRTRGLAAGAAMTVAAVAVATPLAWSSLRGTDDTPYLPATSSQTEVPSSTASSNLPTQSATGTPVPPTTRVPGTTTGAPAPGTSVPTHDNDAAPARVVTVGSTAPLGAAPDTAWTFDRTVHRDGRTTPLSVGSEWSYTPLADGRGVVIDATWNDGGTVRVIDAAGQTVREVLAVPTEHTTQIAANDAGTRFTVLVNVPGASGDGAAITTFDKDGLVVASKGNLLNAVDLVGLVGDRVFLGNGTVDRSYVWDLRSNVIDRYTDSRVIRAVNESTQQAAMFTPNADSTSGCLEVLDVSGGARVLARSCGAFVPTGFSRDGRHLIGHPIGTDGYAATQTDVLDVATGQVALRLRGPAFVDAQFLADGSIALAVVHRHAQSGTTSELQSCTLDGACTRFVEAAPMSDDTARYRLARLR